MKQNILENDVYSNGLVHQIQSLRFQLYQLETRQTGLYNRLLQHVKLERTLPNTMMEQTLTNNYKFIIIINLLNKYFVFFSCSLCCRSIQLVKHDSKTSLTSRSHHVTYLLRNNTNMLIVSLRHCTLCFTTPGPRTSLLFYLL